MNSVCIMSTSLFRHQLTLTFIHKQFTCMSCCPFYSSTSKGCTQRYSISLIALTKMRVTTIEVVMIARQKLSLPSLFRLIISNRLNSFLNTHSKTSSTWDTHLVLHVKLSYHALYQLLVLKPLLYVCGSDKENSRILARVKSYIPL